MFRIARELREKGILGMNDRNLSFIMGHNRRKLFPLVDDKEKTKVLAQAAGLAVPELYGALRYYGDVRSLSELIKPYDEFVLKPAHGSGGNGVLVVSGRIKDNFKHIDGTLLSEDELRYHVINILSGMFSLGGRPDTALVEYRVQFDPLFEEISYLGVPDIRIIVFLGVPVMAMLRLPTKMSRGKANLHQGAVGTGICLKTGVTTSAVWHDSVIREHPDTGHSVSGLQLPRWDELLLLAAKTFELTGLGYQGVDIVFDRELGPLILELNARPGLAIQIANQTGLRPRLELVEKNIDQLQTVEQRVQFAYTGFNEIDKSA